MKCPKCGKEITDDSLYCEYCGEKLKVQPAASKKEETASSLPKKKSKGWLLLYCILIVVLLIVIVILAVSLSQKSGQVEMLECNLSNVENTNQELLESNQELQQQYEDALAAYENEKGEKWVDLGLPSGTLWKNKNEGGGFIYNYYVALKRYKTQLPTQKQFEELINYCTWEWGGDGYRIKGRNGNILFLPASGYSSDGDLVSYKDEGWYCFAVPDGYLHIKKDIRNVHVSSVMSCSVRLVKSSY